MSAKLLPGCVLGLSDETLSAWRDATLPLQEMRRISEHVGGCPVCRAQLAQYDRLATLLRSERVPLPQQSLWPQVRAHLDGVDAPASRPRMTRTTLRPRSRRRAIAGISSGLSALAAVLIIALVVALVHLHGGPVRPNNAYATPTVAPAHSLVWKKVSFPSDFANPHNEVSMALAPNDPDTAYVCLPVRNDLPITPEIWATHNRGASWQIVGHLPPHHTGTCELVVDAAQSQTIIATDTFYAPKPGPENAFASIDGGKTWQSLGSNQQFFELASYHGITYALRATQVNQQNGPIHLAASTDQMQSWQNVDLQLISAGETIQGFWLNPYTGSMLIFSYNTSPTPAEVMGDGGKHFWESSDGGQHWNKLASPNIQPGSLAVQASISGLPWHICVTAQNVGNPNADANQLTCTSDGGASWTPRPALTTTATMELITIAANGSLLADTNDQNLLPNTTHIPGITGIFRLPPNSRTWDYLGVSPVSYGGFMPVVPNTIWFTEGCAGSTIVCYTTGPQNAYTTTYP